MTEAMADNITPLGVDEAEFLAFAKDIGKLEFEVKQLRQKLNKRRQEAKAAGVKLGIFDAMRKLADLPRNEGAENLAHSRAYLQWLKSPLGHQFSLELDPPDDPMDEGAGDEAAAARVTEDAHGQGYRAGLSGVWEDDNPHEANSPAGQAWLKGYREAQAIQVQKMAKGGKKK